MSQIRKFSIEKRIKITNIALVMLTLKENSLETVNYDPIFLKIKDTDPAIAKKFIEKQREKYFKENVSDQYFFDDIKEKRH